MKSFKVALCTVLFLLSCGREAGSGVRPSALAGTWYPAGAGELASTVDALLAKARGGPSPAKPLILIVPHAGYPFSGAVAAAGYASVKGFRPDIIVILAPSHHGSFHGCAAATYDRYETPLGRVPVDTAYSRALSAEKHFLTDRYAEDREHAVEIQLPFIQRLIGSGVPILPFLAGDIAPEEAKSIASALAARLRDKKRPLIIVSTDFTHYGPRFGYTPFGDGGDARKRVKALDEGAIALIGKRDAEGFAAYVERTGATICGRNAILIALSLPLEGAEARLLAYDTSGNITGDHSNSVSYAAIAIGGALRYTALEPGAVIPAGDRKYLLGLARNSIRARLDGRGPAAIDASKVPRSCCAGRGAFVTLKKKGELRGCIGYIASDRPLYRVVMDSSCNAAFSDPRFAPLDKSELNDISIEISVLTEPRAANSAEEVVVGRDGIIIEQGRSRGLLLPQVPVEWGWDREQFLVHGCRKAGLPDYSWKHGAKIYTFRAEVFGEGEAP